MPTATLPHGDVNYRVAGPADSSAPPVVFVHGFLVDGRLWTGVADELAAAAVRSYAPDLPLGSHRIAVREGTDQSPRGVARQVIAFIEALGLTDVTLVGNDTGGAVCQLLLDTDASRIGRVVLTNCDAFENFPPKWFAPLFWLAKRPRGLAGMLQVSRLRMSRHSPLAFGLLMRRPIDAVLTKSWLTPGRTSSEVRRDAAAFARGVDAQELRDVATRFHRFTRPVLIVWGSADRFFTISTARRLAAAFPDARLIEVEGGRTFIPIDAPSRVADAIASFSPADAT